MIAKPFTIGQEAWTYIMDPEDDQFELIDIVVKDIHRDGILSTGDLIYAFNKVFHTKEDAVTVARKRIENQITRLQKFINRIK